LIRVFWLQGQRLTCWDFWERKASEWLVQQDVALMAQLRLALALEHAVPEELVAEASVEDAAEAVWAEETAVC
jgi:hypothetical protein